MTPSSDSTRTPALRSCQRLGTPAFPNAAMVEEA